MRGVGGEAHDAAEGGEGEGEGEGNPGECQVGSGERRMGRRSKGERSMEEVRVLKFYFVGYSWSFLGFKLKKKTLRLTLSNQVNQRLARVSVSQER